MTEVVPNQAYDAWNVKSLLFIPVFLFSEDYVRKGVLHDLKETRSEERIAFGNSLSEKRRESGLSQEELGQIIGKSSNAISRYENAENTMDVHTFAKTVNALKISPYELLLELEEPERNPEVVSLIFELGRLEHKKQKVVLETMKAMINSLSSME